MKDALAGLEPRSVWEHFAAIARTPRPSKHEEKIVEYVLSVAKEHGFPVDRDGTGNLVVRVPASKGREKAPTVVVQGHLDMVCEKNKDVEHDFMNDPIDVRIDGEWVRANGTTLGADNGIGVAAALAIATDPRVEHGPLELLMTLDEETGLTGAMGLDGSLLRGRTMLNLDSEEDGVIFVGCAGGCDTHLRVTAERTAAAPGAKPCLLEVSGLRGGHSGLDIRENRGNALKLLARTLASALDAGIDVGLASLQGGSKHNAIPREAEAVLLVTGAERESLAEVVGRSVEAFRTELEGIDDGLKISLGDAPAGDHVPLSSSARDRLLGLLCALPHGVLAMSGAIEGLVETSSNLAVVDEHGGQIRVITSSRSSIAASLQGILGQIRAVGRLAGAEVRTLDGYPGWKPNMASPALGVVRAVYREHWGSDPEITAIHAGLECGLLGEKVPGLDMVSFGPQIRGAHSPDESVNVPSVERFWKALVDVVDRLSS